MNNKDITVTFGESLRLTTEITDDLADLQSLTFYVGLGGEALPVLTSVATVTATEATIYEQEIDIEVGSYFYQYKAVYTDGSIYKFPEVSSCNPSLPRFIVTDSLDDIEVS